MAITFDAVAKRIILDSSSITATEVYSRWVDWASLDDNAKYGVVVRQVGSDDLGGGLSIPPYYFLQGSWRVRPTEANQLLILTGNLFVEAGGQPVVNTLGAFNVSVQYTVPVQAQAFSSGGITNITNNTTLGLTPEQTTQLSDAAIQATIGRKLSSNKALISPDGRLVTIYDDDGVTILTQYQISADKLTRTPV
jgi:hypothetical protein